MTDMRNTIDKLQFFHILRMPTTFGDDYTQAEQIAKLIYKINEIIDMLKGVGFDKDAEVLADRLKQGRLIELINEVEGQAIFDGSKDIKIDTEISQEFINRLKSEIITEINSIIGGLENYILPKASEGILGGVKVGSGLGITEDGTLYVLNREDVPVEPEIPVEPPVQEEFDYYDLGYLEYDFNDVNKTAEVLGYKSTEFEERLVIPDNVIKDGVVYAVTDVGEKAFYYKRLKSITLGNKLVRIKANAFSGVAQNYRMNLVFPDSLRYIDIGAFSNNFYLEGDINLKSIIQVSRGVFTNNHVSSITIPNEISMNSDGVVQYGSSLGGNPTIPNSENIGIWDKVYETGIANETRTNFGWYKRA